MDQQNIMHRAPGVAQSNTKKEIQPVVISLDDIYVVVGFIIL